jgi:hypothetical protein
MEKHRRQYGFSLTETLLAVGTLAVGLLFIGGTFMTGVYFSTVSTERTIAAVVADEAFAKIRLYGLDPDANGLSTTQFVPCEKIRIIPASEYLYPSTGESSSGQYSWAAICRRAGANSRLIQVTVFICRTSGADAKYWVRRSGAATGFDTSNLPRPVRVRIASDAASQATGEVTILDPNAADGVDERAFINDGAFIVDDATGQTYRVLERSATQPDRIRLALVRPGGDLTPPKDSVWVVPPPASGGRNPVVAVYQKVFRFKGL